jgi:hypothetical protein
MSRIISFEKESLAILIRMSSKNKFVFLSIMKYIQLELSILSQKFQISLRASSRIPGSKKSSTKIPVPKKWSGTACLSDNG